jgi:hypothetical protein
VPPTSVEPTVQPDGVWNPPCAERTDPTAAPIADERALDTFGPLGAAPILDITLPLGQSSPSETPSAPLVSVDRVPGGVLLLIGPSSFDSFWSWWLTSVDAAGGVRWVRCEEGASARSLVVGPASDAPDTALVEELVSNVDASPTSVWHAIDLATGSDVAPPQGLDGVQLLASAGRHALFGPQNGRVVDVDTDRLTLLDLVTLESSQIPFPDETNGQGPFGLYFGMTDDGTVVYPEPNSARAITAVYRDGEWRSDEASILAAWPIRVAFSFDGDIAELVGRDGLGEVVWSRPELTDIGNEGFRTATSDDMTVVSACVTRTIETGCTDVALFGIVTETGDIRWRLPGRRSVSAAGGGFALATDGADVASDTVPDPPGYVMIDTSTGAALGDDQHWDDPEEFRTGCCGESEFVRVRRDGGVVIATNYERVRVWYPATIDAGTRTVRIGA